MKNQNLIIAAIVALVVGAAGGFFGGMQYQKMQPVSFNGQTVNGADRNGNFQRFGQRNGGTRGGGAVIGEILSADDTSLTIKLADGSSKIILLTNSTSISKSLSASKTDLAAGINVAIFGVSNSDGTVTATNVQINPVMRTGTLNNNQQK